MPLDIVASNGKRFVTDFGASHTAVSSTGEEMHISRYGVWEDIGHGKAEVIFTTDSLHEAEVIMTEGVDRGIY